MRRFPLLAAALLLLFGFPPAAGAQEVGQHLSGVVSNPAALSQHTIDVSETETPASPPIEELANQAFVGPFTDGVFQLTYTGLNGRIYVVAYPVQIDNASPSHQITVNIRGRVLPVSSLADVFRLLPTPPSPQPALLRIDLSLPVTIAIQAVALVADTKYVTDQYDPANPDTDKVVKTLDRGHPTAANLTNAQVDGIINGNTAGLRAKLTKTDDPTWSYDCHGWTFTGGAKWINDSEVQKILDGNGYNARPAGQVQVGDLVIYKNGGAIKHSGIVTMVNAGNATEVESKWGPGGRYKHAPTDVMSNYGAPSYFFSNRAGGHNLKTQP